MKEQISVEILRKIQIGYGEIYKRQIRRDLNSCVEIYGIKLCNSIKESHLLGLQTRSTVFLENRIINIPSKILICERGNNILFNFEEPDIENKVENKIDTVIDIPTVNLILAKEDDPKNVNLY